MNNHPLKFAAFLLLAFFAVLARAEQTIPQISWIADPDNILTQQQRNQISASAAKTDTQTKAVMATIIIRSLDGEPIESYAQRAAAAWSPGYEGDMRGAILVISAGDRKVRIETSKNLSVTLTDSRASQIIDAMKPALKKGDWTTAILTFYDKALPYAGLAPEQAAQKLAEDEHDRKMFGLLLGGFFLVFGAAACGIWYYCVQQDKKRLREEEEFNRRKQAEWEAATSARRQREREQTIRDLVNPRAVTAAAAATYTPPRQERPVQSYTPPPPPPPKRETRRNDDDDGYVGAAAAIAAVAAVAAVSRSSERSSDDSDSRSTWSSPSSDSGGGSSYDGGGSSSDF